MTIFIKYPRQTKKRNKEWIKKMESKNINWAQIGGWFDSDGSFSINQQGKRKDGSIKLTAVCKISLKDRDPVEFFARLFETTLSGSWTNTETPDGKKHRVFIYVSRLRSERAFWFANHVKKYIQQKTTALQKVLQKGEINNFVPYSEKWSREEWIAYMATLIEGDGGYRKNVLGGGHICMLNSSNENFLKYIRKELTGQKLANFGKINKHLFIKKGIPRKKPMYSFYLMRDEYIISFLESMLPYATMGRKKQYMIDNINQLKKKQSK